MRFLCSRIGPLSLTAMKTIQESLFAGHLKAALIEANYGVRSDIRTYLEKLASEIKPEQKKIVEVFRENDRISNQEKRALCQDTGYVQLFVTLGREVMLDFNLENTANRVVAEVYRDESLRKSLAHPVTRENTGDNTPVYTDIELSDGAEFEVSVLLKGGGSENVTKAGFLLPTAGREEIEKWAADAVKSAGAKACPPYLIGVAVGGNLEKALYHSKKLLLKNMGDDSEMNELEKSLARSIKSRINALPIGFQGMGFGETAMSVQVKTIPCHIATLPAAVSIGCNAVRQSTFRLD